MTFQPAKYAHSEKTLTPAATNPASPARKRTRSPALSPAERLEAEQVARRLHDELRSALHLVPPHTRGASALARHLRIDRATCQRIVACLARPDQGVLTLVHLPGLEGLRLFLKALGEAQTPQGSDAETLAAARAAVDRFGGLLKTLRVSQRGLRAVLVRVPPPLPAHDPSLGQDDPGAREAIYHAAHAALGRATATLISVRVINLYKGDPAHTESINVRGHIGHTARQGALPLEIGAFAASPAGAPGAMYTTLDPQPETGPSRWGSLVAPFCSKPLPRVVTRHDGSRVIHAVEAPPADAAHPIDIIIANRTGLPEPHPAGLAPPVGEVSSLVQFPARRLVMDVLLHKEIARRCTPSLQTHLWTPTGGHVVARWSTRVPGGPALQTYPTVMGAPAPWSRHRALLDHVFDHTGWNAQEFILYRCQVEWPLWRCGYHMLFDFTADPAK